MCIRDRAKCIPHRHGSKAAVHAITERRPKGRRHLRSNNTTSRTMDPRKEKGSKTARRSTQRGGVERAGTRQSRPRSHRQRPAHQHTKAPGQIGAAAHKTRCAGGKEAVDSRQTLPGTLCTSQRAVYICGLGRSAALQILAIATAIAAFCALQPIPIRSAHLPLDSCRGCLALLRTPFGKAHRSLPVSSPPCLPS